MPEMTWGEFKRRVEAAGAKDDDPIEYIDISWLEAGSDRLNVTLEVLHPDSAPMLAVSGS